MAQMWMFERWRGAFDAVVANSRSVQGRLRKVGISTDVIWNGVPERGIHGDLSAEPVAGFAGRLVKENGVCGRTELSSYKNRRDQTGGQDQCFSKEYEGGASFRPAWTSGTSRAEASLKANPFQPRRTAKADEVL